MMKRSKKWLTRKQRRSKMKFLRNLMCHNKIFTLGFRPMYPTKK